MNQNELHVGEIIRNYIRENNITIDRLAEIIPCDRRNVFRILNKERIDTGLLSKISVGLGHDFFADLSEILNHN